MQTLLRTTTCEKYAQLLLAVLLLLKGLKQLNCYGRPTLHSLAHSWRERRKVGKRTNNRNGEKMHKTFNGKLKCIYWNRPGWRTATTEKLKRSRFKNLLSVFSICSAYYYLCVRYARNAAVVWTIFYVWLVSVRGSRAIACAAAKVFFRLQFTCFV